MYNDIGIDDFGSPERYLEYIITNTEIKLKEDFNIASINYINSNKKNCGNAKKLIFLSEELLKLLNIESIVIQLLNPQLDIFYEKFNYQKLKLKESQYSKDNIYMQKIL